jgi:hypothetical protein
MKIMVMFMTHKVTATSETNPLLTIDDEQYGNAKINSQYFTRFAILQ